VPLQPGLLHLLKVRKGDDISTSSRVSVSHYEVTLGFLAIFSLAAILFLTNIGVYKKFERAERYFSLGSKTLLETNEFLLPTFAHASKTAHLAALRKLLETSTSERRKDQLKSVIEEVEKQP
jgi:hypothetical protein